MSKKMNIVIDVDNVILDSDIAICDYYNNEMFNHKDFVPADGEKIYYYNATRCQMPLFTSKQLVDSFETDFFWDNVMIKPGCIEVIERLCNDVRYNVMGWSYGTMGNLIKKLKFLNVPFGHLVESKKLEIIVSTHNTDEPTEKYIAAENGMLLDDLQYNLQSNKTNNVLMFDRGIRDFNKDFDGLKVTSWNDVEFIANYIYENKFLPQIKLENTEGV